MESSSDHASLPHCKGKIQYEKRDTDVIQKAKELLTRASDQVKKTSGQAQNSIISAITGYSPEKLANQLSLSQVEKLVQGKQVQEKIERSGYVCTNSERHLAQQYKEFRDHLSTQIPGFDHEAFMDSFNRKLQERDFKTSTGVIQNRERTDKIKNHSDHIDSNLSINKNRDAGEHSTSSAKADDQRIKKEVRTNSQLGQDKSHNTQSNRSVADKTASAGSLSQEKILNIEKKLSIRHDSSDKSIAVEYNKVGSHGVQAKSNDHILANERGQIHKTDTDLKSSCSIKNFHSEDKHSVGFVQSHEFKTVSYINIETSSLRSHSKNEQGKLFAKLEKILTSNPSNQKSERSLAQNRTVDAQAKIPNIKTDSIEHIHAITIHRSLVIIDKERQIAKLQIVTPKCSARNSDQSMIKAQDARLSSRLIENLQSIGKRVRTINDLPLPSIIRKDFSYKPYIFGTTKNAPNKMIDIAAKPSLNITKNQLTSRSIKEQSPRTISSMISNRNDVIKSTTHYIRDSKARGDVRSFVACNRLPNRRYMIGSELALAVIIASSGLARIRTQNQDEKQTDQKSPTGHQVYAINAKSLDHLIRAGDNKGKHHIFKAFASAFNDSLKIKKKLDAINKYITSEERSQNDEVAEPSQFGSNNFTGLPTVFIRPTVLINCDETLITIAEKFFGDGDLAWLIGDLNHQNVTESWFNGTRVIEIKSRQSLILPVWQDIVEFYQFRSKDWVKENIMTVVNETEMDRELTNSTLGPVIGQKSAAKNRSNSSILIRRSFS